MKCNIKKLDKRFNYHHYFNYVIEFDNDMSKYRGPENYIILTEALREAFDPSTHITVWSVINEWNNHKLAVGLEVEEQHMKFVNLNWCYTTTDHDQTLKIYVKDNVLSWLMVRFDLEKTG